MPAVQNPNPATNSLSDLDYAVSIMAVQAGLSGVPTLQPARSSPGFYNALAGGVRYLGLDAWLPKDVEISTSAKWEAPFTSLASKLAPANTVLQSIPGIFGRRFSAQYQSLSKAYWAGSEPVTIRLPLEFRAVDGALTDIHDKFRSLHSLTLPIARGGGAGALGLQAPGPTGGLFVQVRIGRSMLFSDVIVTDVSSSLRMIIGEEGYPVKAKIQVTFQTSTILSLSDWMEITAGENPGAGGAEDRAKALGDRRAGELQDFRQKTTGAVKSGATAVAGNLVVPGLGTAINLFNRGG